MVWRDDSQLGESRGHAFSSPRLRATVLRHINTYTSADKTSLHEQTVFKDKVASNQSATITQPS